MVPLVVGAGSGVEDLVVEIDVLDVERDVLLGLPVDRLASSASVMTGRLIFLTMTALPESEAATSLVLKALFWNSRRMASATAAPSMIAPSTMLSGGTASIANAATRNPLPDGFNSTALTALEPMSRPTTDSGFAKTKHRVDSVRLKVRVHERSIGNRFGNRVFNAAHQLVAFNAAHIVISRRVEGLVASAVPNSTAFCSGESDRFVAVGGGFCDLHAEGSLPETPTRGGQPTDRLSALRGQKAPAAG